MELRQIRSFVALAEELHFGRAAARLFLAQPALSQQIKQLEESLEASLFARTSRSVALTEAGKAFLPRARTVLRELSEAQEDLRSVDAGITGTVRVGFVSTAAVQIIPNVLSALSKKFPNIQIQLREADSASQLRALLANEMDIGFMHPTELPPALEEHAAESSSVVLALPAKHPLASASRLNLKDLSQETFILPSATPHRDFHDLIASLFLNQHFAPSRRQEITMLQTALPLIAAGVGCALLPDVFERLKPRGVVFRKLSGMQIRLPIFAVLRRDGSSRLIQNVLQLVTTHGTTSR